jgi:hypothetical protein
MPAPHNPISAARAGLQERLRIAAMPDIVDNQQATSIGQDLR